MKCKYCKGEIIDEAQICNKCYRFQDGRWRRSTIFIAFGVIMTLFAAVFAAYTSNKISKNNEKLVILRIQQELRKNYNTWYDDVKNNQIDLKNAAMIPKYEHDEDIDKLIDKYWSNVTYNEYLTFHKSIQGIDHYWAYYDSLISHGLQYRPVLRHYLIKYKTETIENIPNSYEEDYLKYLDDLLLRSRSSGKKELPEEELNIQTVKPEETESPKSELDNFFMTLTYAMIEVDWQENNKRGYNIGAILVDSSYQIAAFNRNQINSRNSVTQHAETGLIYEFLDTTWAKSLKGYKLYTSLEPCAMCAGVILMTEISEVVYGQKDNGYGGTLGRLSFYPTASGLNVTKTSDSITRILDSEYKMSLSTNDEHHIIEYLTRSTTRSHFQSAKDNILQYPVRFEENYEIIESGKTFFRERINI